MALDARCERISGGLDGIKGEIVRSLCLRRLQDTPIQTTQGQWMSRMRCRQCYYMGTLKRQNMGR